MRVLLVRFDAPLMSFGDVRVDGRGPVADHPGLGQVTGLLANGLGYDHSEVERLARLQERLRIASRCDRSGEMFTDFQTVDLGQEAMREGWTTRGRLEARRGGHAREGTHIRLRQFHSGRVQTLAITLLHAAEEPTIEILAASLDTPARPLFLGRKPCIPAGRLLIGQIEATSLMEALAQAPRCQFLHEADPAKVMKAWWPEDPSTAAPADSHVLAVVDERNWRGQTVGGRRLVRTGLVTPAPAPHA